MQTASNAIPVGCTDCYPQSRARDLEADERRMAQKVFQASDKAFQTQTMLL